MDTPVTSADAAPIAAIVFFGYIDHGTTPPYLAITLGSDHVALR